MQSIHDMIKNQVTEELQRKIDTAEPCRECVNLQARLLQMTDRIENLKKEIRQLEDLL